MKEGEGLRQRTTQKISHSKKRNDVGDTASHNDKKGETTTTTTTEQQPMVGHRRGPVLAYSRGGNVAASRQTLSNYKNKILIALGATILYTAWLYRSGKSRLQKLK